MLRECPSSLVIFLPFSENYVQDQSLFLDCCYLTCIMVVKGWSHTMGWGEQKPVGSFTVVRLCGTLLTPLDSFVSEFQLSASLL